MRLLIMIILLGGCATSNHYRQIKVPEPIKYQRPVMAPPPAYGNKIV